MDVRWRARVPLVVGARCGFRARFHVRARRFGRRGRRRLHRILYSARLVWGWRGLAFPVPSPPRAALPIALFFHRPAIVELSAGTVRRMCRLLILLVATGVGIEPSAPKPFDHRRFRARAAEFDIALAPCVGSRGRIDLGWNGSCVLRTHPTRRSLRLAQDNVPGNFARSTLPDARPLLQQSSTPGALLRGISATDAGGEGPTSWRRSRSPIGRRSSVSRTLTSRACVLTTLTELAPGFRSTVSCAATATSRRRLRTAQLERATRTWVYADADDAKVPTRSTSRIRLPLSRRARPSTASGTNWRRTPPTFLVHASSPRWSISPPTLIPDDRGQRQSLRPRRAPARCLSDGQKPRCRDRLNNLWLPVIERYLLSVTTQH